MPQGTRRRKLVVRSMAGVAVIGLVLALVPWRATSAAPAAPAAPAATLTNAQAAIAWSKFTFKDGTASTALLARDDHFADTLTSGPIQKALNAPLLLTASAKLSPDTATELKRLGAKRVIIIGGAQAVSSGVENEVKALQLTTERVGGATPTETAVAAAAKFFPTASSALVVPAQMSADSLASSTFAAQKGMPILFTETAKLSSATEQYLKGASPQGSKLQSFVIVGGEAAVSKAAADALAALSKPGGAEGAKAQVTRVFGPNRFATAVALNKALGYDSAKAAPRIILLEGQGANSWASGLGSPVQAGKGGGATVLVSGDTVPSESAAFLGGGSKTPLVCGPGVSKTSCESAGKLLGLTG